MKKAVGDIGNAIWASAPEKPFVMIIGLSEVSKRFFAPLRFPTFQCMESRVGIMSFEESRLGNISGAA